MLLKFCGLYSIIIYTIIYANFLKGLFIMINVGFVGAGNMATAIIKGISTCALSDEISLFAADVDNEKVNALGSCGVAPCKDAAEIAEKCKYIFLAVKPQVIEGVLESLKGKLSGETVIISIAAGISGEFIQNKTQSNVKVVLVMPNTPLLLGEGASALAKVDPITDEEFEFVKSIFDACGKTAVLSKDKMKEIIAVNGSSPAFIYLYAKAFIEYAESVGIDGEAAKILFSQSLIGSAKMITDSGYSVDELIKMVSSPGGTTLAGLDELYNGNLEEITKKACKSCTRRAYELSK